MKRIRLSVPADASFDAVRDLDGTVAEVADPKDRYRYKRDDYTVDFEATGETSVDAGEEIEVFRAVRLHV
ncbi:hypothetical protein [Marinactinospora thermotolerans]|nr:hypothetical protein [Marinactinospora thermotolerans]